MRTQLRYLSVRVVLVVICFYYSTRILFVNPTIDGTVEGDNIHFPDSNKTHDHTYYGSFCSDPWDSTKPNYGGSGVACTSRIRQTGDGENQKNGTYYHSQAASSGTSASMSTENTNTPDTFCPLGWQIPYGGTGGDYYDKSRSWRYLLSKYNISHSPGDAQNAAKIAKYPFSIILGGFYYWSTGQFYGGQSGQYETNTVKDNANMFRFRPTNIAINLSEGSTKYDGNNIRCIYHFSIILPLRVRICVIQNLKASFHFFISLVHRRHGGRN